ncbi:hypothetical protein ACUOFC_52000, partial [Escherichia sp. TWPC-MK]
VPDVRSEAATASRRRYPSTHQAQARLGTPSGKIEIYSKTLEKFGYKDCPAHPTWLAPDEWKGTADEKQLQLLTAHPAHRLHSQLNYAELRKKYAVADREPITI